MIEAGLAALENSALAELLRSSQYLYPLVNAAHILALATLFGSILALDLRLLGAFRTVPLLPLAQVLPRVAGTGLAFAVLTGTALFSVQPLDYLAHPAMPVKLVLVALGAVHALAVHRSPAWRGLVAGETSVPGRLRLSAAISLACWTAVILCGRFLAF
ncbi:hypothetical protein [Qipengyuania sp. MTN3-11]|uniref:hypothetical protein n=1 Tax=Qipengyuania sp. MTN3-11 TaxID=3056557 RepID=UPI0036F20274